MPKEGRHHAEIHPRNATVRIRSGCLSRRSSLQHISNRINYLPRLVAWRVLQRDFLDAHRHHPQPFTEEELRPYRYAAPPESQKEAIRRRKVMRTARSSAKRGRLLRNTRYAASVWH